MNIEFIIRGDHLVFVYEPIRPWVLRELREDGEVTVKKIFSFLREDLLSSTEDEDEPRVEFIIGHLSGDYFKIEPRILGTTHPIFIHKSIKPTIKFFVAERGISIFLKLSRAVKGDLYIGGDNPTALPEDEFKKLLKDFPNSYEIEKYVDARLGAVLSNHFESASELEEKYNSYMNKRKSVSGEDLLQIFRDSELQKYKIILDKLEHMLGHENAYNEEQWQAEILQIILLLYPKYIRAFTKVLVRDTYSERNKFLDFLLIDSNGHIDIIEIKKPFDQSIVTLGKYRNNHIPKRELSGAVMQVEKYIFYLNKWGKTGEEKLTAKYKSSLPKNLQIKVTNPCGLIIMGRDIDLSPVQYGDFEVIKRKYKNIIDIITYDDLLRRLKFIIEALTRP